MNAKTAALIAGIMATIPLNQNVDANDLLGQVRADLSTSQRQVGDALALDGLYLIEVRDANGRLKDRRVGHNQICTAGKNEVLKASSALYLNQFAYIAVGTSSTAPAAGDTTLGSQTAISTVITPTNPSASVLQFQFTFSAGAATGALVECGLFSAATSGKLLSHLTFSVINVASGDTIQITYQLS